jgi:hypothetical protein
LALELKIEAFKPVAVDFNYKELKKEIEEKTRPYKGLIVTEDAIPVAKTDLANLRKLEKAIDDRRKAVKKEYNAPYMTFEAQIKDILSDIQAAEGNIDGQIKEFERRADEEKLGQIKVFYGLVFGDLAKNVPFEKVYNPKWLNKGYKMPDIEAEISKAANTLRDNIETVKGLKSDHELSLMRTLFFTLDIGEVLKEHNALEVLAEARKAQEQEKAKQVVAEEPKTGDTATQTPVEPEFTVDTPEPVQEIAFRVWVNNAQKAALRNFLVSNGIRYGKA